MTAGKNESNRDVSTIFVSYRHDDNEHLRGAIIQLAKAIQEEYYYISGQSIGLFLDRDNIRWGDDLDGAIGMGKSLVELNPNTREYEKLTRDITIQLYKVIIFHRQQKINTDTDSVRVSESEVTEAKSDLEHVDDFQKHLRYLRELDSQLALNLMGHKDALDNFLHSKNYVPSNDKSGLLMSIGLKDVTPNFKDLASELFLKRMGLVKSCGEELQSLVHVVPLVLRSTVQNKLELCQLFIVYVQGLVSNIKKSISNDKLSSIDYYRGPGPDFVWVEYLIEASHFYMNEKLSSYLEILSRHVDVWKEYRVFEDS